MADGAPYVHKPTRRVAAVSHIDCPTCTQGPNSSHLSSTAVCNDTRNFCWLLLLLHRRTIIMQRCLETFLKAQRVVPASQLSAPQTVAALASYSLALASGFRADALHIAVLTTLTDGLQLVPYHPS